MGLIAPIITAAATTASIWIVPFLAATLSFYQYDEQDPEGRPRHTKVCKKHYNENIISIPFPGYL